jgi:DNA repair photolyase
VTIPNKGRGAVSNPESRFLATRLEPFDDGWGLPDEAPLRATEVRSDHNRSVLTANQSPDIPFELSINPYKGCEHGCIYCYARPSHAYLGLSPGLDFETILFRKTDVTAQLERALGKRGYRVRPITIGANTDPYQPIEREYVVTREALTVLAQWRHPAAIITKGGLILRDRDLLAEMADMSLIHVFVSITTLEASLARTLEPRAAAPQRRLEVIAKLTRAGIPTSVNVAPIIPAINDHEIESILTAAAAAGAHSANYIPVRLPNEVKDLFREWLEAHFPDRAEHVMSLIRQMRGGRENDPRFGHRFRGQGPYADLLRDRFRLARKRVGLDRDVATLACNHFRRPARVGDQLNLFEGL